MSLLRILFFGYLLIHFLSGFTQSRRLVEVSVEKGDGINSLLRKYQIYNPCNISFFRQANKLRKNQGLRLGKTYRLPIYVYTYNGKSIRSTTGNNDRPWAEKIQLYNEIMHQSGLKKGDYRTDRVLWVPYHQIHCKSQDQPLVPAAALASNFPRSQNGSVAQTSVRPSGNVPLRGTYPIFGPKMARVPLESTRLSGLVYYIVGGHGGPDPGAVGTFYGKNLCEDEYAYDIALRLTRNLLSHGATVYLITRDEDDGIRSGEILPCDKDETCWVDQEIPVSQAERLAQRSDAINLLYEKNKKQGVTYQRLVVIHVDSNNQSEKTDVYFYHKIDDQNSQKLANTLQQTMKQKYDEYRKDRGYEGTVSARDLHMLRETDPTAVFIELGNIRNRNDQARLVIEGNRILLAHWLLEGLMREARR